MKIKEIFKSKILAALIFLKRNIDARDFHAYVGTALLAAGGYFIYKPLALIIPGAVFLYIAFRNPFQEVSKWVSLQALRKGQE